MMGMDLVELGKLIEKGECQSVEFSESADKELGKTMCALANTEGGFLLVGVDDKGNVVGVKNADEAQRRLRQSLQTCEPVPIANISVVASDGKAALAVQISKTDVPCYCNGAIYLRVGSTNQRLSGHMLEEFLKDRQFLRFDGSSSKATIADVEESAVEDFLSRRNPSLEKSGLKGPQALKNVLLTLGAARQNGQPVLTNAGALFFAKKPSEFLPQNQVKLVRFKGVAPVDISNVSVMNGRLVENIEAAFSFVQRNSATAYKIGDGLQRREISEYPLEAVREALVNAVAHRDYFSFAPVQASIFDDRLEVANPGSLPKGLSVEKLPMLGLGIPRNPTIYRLLSEARYIEAIGTGIPRMISAMRKAGLPDPVFEDFGGFFKVTLYNEKGLEKMLSRLGVNLRQYSCLGYLKENNQITSKEYAGKFGVSIPTAVADLNKLAKFKLARKTGKKRSTKYELEPEAASKLYKRQSG